MKSKQNPRENIIKAIEQAEPAPANKRRGNPNWGKPEPLIAEPTISSFELLVKDLKLKPEQYRASDTLKNWVRDNKDHKYVPLDLLRFWGFTVRSEV